MLYSDHIFDLTRLLLLYSKSQHYHMLLQVWTVDFVDFPNSSHLHMLSQKVASALQIIPDACDLQRSANSTVQSGAQLMQPSLRLYIVN